MIATYIGCIYVSLCQNTILTGRRNVFYYWSQRGKCLNVKHCLISQRNCDDTGGQQKA